MPSQATVAVLGAGAWGTALAMQLARNGTRVKLWGHRPAHIENLLRDRENRAFLPGIALPEQIHPEPDVRTCVAHAESVLIAIPSQAFPLFLQQLAPVLKPATPVFWASKGFDVEHGELLHRLISQALPGHHYGVVSGPTFAAEVARGLPAAMVCAGNDETDTAHFAQLFHGNRLRCYTSDDVIGVELGGALKNVLALAVGIADGLGFGANTRAALMTRGLSEMMRLGQRFGARKETLMGLSGLGDLILSCTDDQSRNRRFGLMVGQGKSRQEAEVELKQTVEGLRAARASYLLSQQLNLELPIMTQVYRVLYEGIRPVDAVRLLENRPQGPEFNDW